MKKILMLTFAALLTLMSQAADHVTLRSGNPRVFLEQATTSFVIDWDHARVTNWDDRLFPQYLKHRGNDFVRDWPQDRKKAEEYFTYRFNKKNGYWKIKESGSTDYKMIVHIATLDVGNGASSFIPMASVKAGGAIINGTLEVRDRANKLLCTLNIEDEKGIGHMSETVRYGLALMNLANDLNSFVKDVKKGKVQATASATDSRVSHEEPAEPAPKPVVVRKAKRENKNLYRVTAQKVNVRSAATTKSTIAGSLLRDELVEVQNISGGWATINYKGATRYVSASYLQKEPERFIGDDIEEVVEQPTAREQLSYEPEYRQTYVETQSSGKYDHGHKGLDVSFEGGVNAGKGGATGIGYIELGKRFNQNFYWGFIGTGAIGGGKADMHVPIGTTFKVLFPVTSSGIAPNIAFRPAFLINTGEDKTIGSGRQKQTIKAEHSMLFALMPGFQIPLGQKVDFNLNFGYACSVMFGGGGAGHGFIATTGFGFHKPWSKSRMRVKEKRPKVPTRDHGLQYTIEGGCGFNSSVFRGGPAFILSYKWNPNISVGVGYGFGGMSVTRKSIEERVGDRYYGGGNTYKDEQGQTGAFQSFFLRGQYRVTDKKLSPFASVDLGFRSYHLEDLWYDSDFKFDKDPSIKKGGFILAPAVGGSLRLSNNSYLELKLGYNISNGIKERKGHYKWGNGYGNSYLTFKRTSFSDFFFSLGFTHTMRWGSGIKGKVENQYQKSKSKIGKK